MSERIQQVNRAIEVMLYRSHPTRSQVKAHDLFREAVRVHEMVKRAQRRHFVVSGAGGTNE